MKDSKALYIAANGTLLVAANTTEKKANETQLYEISRLLGHDKHHGSDSPKYCYVEYSDEEVVIVRFPNNLNFSLGIPVSRVTVITDPGDVKPHRM
jgi:hypothetical protein